MKSIKNYSDNKLSFLNSLQGKLENEPKVTFESLVGAHGSAIDSIFQKMRLHNYRIANPNYIHESAQDVRFDLSEQLAARDMLLTICEQYEIALYREFCEEYNIEIQIDEAFESAKAFLNKVRTSVKDATTATKDAFNKVLDKLKAVKEFVSNVTKGIIKSAKELVQKLTEMMISLGISFVELLKKIGGGSDEDFETFKGKVSDALKSEKTAKENVYETLANHINSNYGRIDEGFFDVFKRKSKDKNKDASQDTADEKGKNEYDHAENAKTTGKDKTWMQKAGKFLKDFLLNIFAYYAVTVILPAVVTLIAGPLAGAIVEVLAKAIWSGRTIYSQVKGMITLVKSPEYKKYPKWLKLVRWALFFLSMWFACSALKSAIGDGFEIAKKIFEGAAGQVLPSDMVQKITEILNDFVKKITGENAGGYDKMVEAQNACMIKIEKIATEEQKASEKGKEDFDNNNNEGKFKLSETNDFKTMEKTCGKDLTDKLQDYAKADLDSSKECLKYLDGVKADTNGVTALGVDGATLGKLGRTAYIEQVANEIGINPADLHITQVTNNALADETARRAGTVFQLVIKGDATQEMADKAIKAVNTVAQNAGMSGGWVHMFSNIQTNLGFIEKITKIPLDVWTNTFIPFAGVGNIDIAWSEKDGGFKLRLGSRKTQNHYIYDIDEGCVEKIPYNKFIEQYRDRNPKVFAKMEAYINKNVKALEEAVDKIEDKGKLSKDDKKKIELITKHIEDVKEGKSEYDVLVFFTYDKFAESVEIKKKESTNESLQIDEAKVEKGDTKYPVMFINPLILACGDLARQRNTKGPRANLYYIKGLYSRIEFLPMDGGIHISDLVEKIIEIAEYGFNSAMKLAIDIPAFNKGSKRSPKWEVNKDSEHGDKARKDFGGFTNTEITEILNDPDKLSDYMGGRYASDELSGGKHLFTDQISDEELKAHHDKVVKIYKSFIEEDESIKEYIQNSKTLKSYLLDDDGNINDENFEKISDLLIRIELNYKPKKKKSLWQRAKDWFKSDVEKDAKDELDTNEILKLGYKLASKYKKYMKKRIKENLEDDNRFTDLTFLEANLDVFERFYLN